MGFRLTLMGKRMERIWVIVENNHELLASKENMDGHANNIL